AIAQSLESRRRAVSPGVGHYRRSDSEGYNIGDAVQLHSEFARGFGHARDSSVQPVEQDCEPYGARRVIEKMRRLIGGRLIPLYRIYHRVETAQDISNGEHTRNDIYPATYPSTSRIFQGLLNIAHQLTFLSMNEKQSFNLKASS